MNKAFFVVFLGVILGAMTLIFVNQASSPLATILASHQTPSPEGGTAAPQTTPPATTQPEVAKPLPPKPEAVKPAPVNPEPPKPVMPAPEPAKPEVPRPEVPRPEVPKADPPAPEPAKPEPAKPEPATPEAPKPEPVKPEALKPEPVKPEPAKPEVVTSEPVTPEVPKPEPAKPEVAKPEALAPVPVTSKPTTQVNPGGVPTKKTMALVNIGLHFRGNGMVLRIEADAPFSYKTFALSSPDRYVVDLLGTWTNMRAPTVPANSLIKGVRVGKQASGPRLVFDMQRVPKKHSVNWVSPTVLEIVIE